MVTAALEETLFAEVEEFLEGLVGETDLVGDDDLVLTWELEGSTAEGFDGVLHVLLWKTDGHDAGVEGGAGDGAVWLTEGVTHTGLKTIGTSSGKHLVDTENVEWVKVDTEVIAFLVGHAEDVTVSADTSGFEGFRGDVLVFLVDKADADWEIFWLGGTLTGFVTDDTWIWDTTAEAAAWVWTRTIVAVATSWTTTHDSKRHFSSAMSM